MMPTATIHHPVRPTVTVRWALLEGRYPEDITRLAKDSLRVFLLEPKLYDSPGLRGSAKRAELIVKLAYWLAMGQLDADGFRRSVARIRLEDNEGWDVDLCARSSGYAPAAILKMGLFFPMQAVCIGA